MITAVAQQDQIDVYRHPDGAIAIRQQAPGMEEPDIVLVSPENVERVVRALRALKREALELRAEGAV